MARNPTSAAMKATTISTLLEGCHKFNSTYQGSLIVGTGIGIDIVDGLEAEYESATDLTRREVAGTLLQGCRMALRGQLNMAAHNAIRALGAMGVPRTQRIKQFCTDAGIVRL